MTAISIRDHYAYGMFGRSAQNGPVLTFKIGKIQWEVVSSLIEVEADEYDTKFDVECRPLFLHESDYYQSRDWYCDAKFKLILSNKRITFAEYELDYQFSKNSPICEIGTFFGWGYFEYTAEVRIKSMSGFDQPVSEFSCPIDIDSEIVFRNEIHKLYVNKYPLLFCSSVLRELISAENNGRNIIDVIEEFPDFDIEHVVDFIRLLYGRRLELKEKDGGYFFFILRLATKYDVQFLISNLEDFLIAHELNNVPNDEKLEIAEAFKLPKLQLETMRKITMDDIENIIDEIIDGANLRQTVNLLLVHLCTFFDDDDDDDDEEKCLINIAGRLSYCGHFNF